MLHTVENRLVLPRCRSCCRYMMTWLNSRGSQPVISQQAAGNGTAFRLRFSSKGEAPAFVCAFGGRLVR